MPLVAKFYKSQVVMRGVENAHVSKILQIAGGVGDSVEKDHFYSSIFGT